MNAALPWSLIRPSATNSQGENDCFASQRRNQRQAKTFRDDGCRGSDSTLLPVQFGVRFVFGRAIVVTALG